MAGSVREQKEQDRDNRRKNTARPQRNLLDRKKLRKNPAGRSPSRRRHTHNRGRGTDRRQRHTVLILSGRTNHELLFLPKKHKGNRLQRHRHPEEIHFRHVQDKAEKEDRSLQQAPEKAGNGHKKRKKPRPSAKRPEIAKNRHESGFLFGQNILFS